MFRAKPAATAQDPLEGHSNARITAAIILIILGFLTVGCTEPSDESGFSDPKLPLVRGYRSVDNACELTGESAYTINFLDDSADLVTCPTWHAAVASLIARTDAFVVAQTNGFTLF